MDELTRPVPRQAVFNPDPRLTALSGAGAVVAALVALTTADTAGRLLLVIAALLLAAYAVTDLVFRPRLVLADDGVRVRSPLARCRVAWRDVEAVRVDSRLRFGIRSTTLEIDAGDTLVVLSRRALGADPEKVADAARWFRG